jgi:hypothetical protein
VKKKKEAKTAKTEVKPDPFGPAWHQAYGDVGGALVASWKRDISETKCCGLITHSGMFTRLYMARTINEAVRRAQKQALEEAAKSFDEGPPYLQHPGNVATRLRSLARKIKVRG